MRLPTLPTETLLEHLQRAAFAYFRDNLNPRNGLVADTSRPNSLISIAVVGFALSFHPLAVRHGRSISSRRWRARGISSAT